MSLKVHKMISKFHLFIIILFLFNSYFVEVHTKPLPERILISNKNISKYDSISNNSILNSKAGINITNFILKRKLDNFTNNNDEPIQNITDDKEINNGIAILNKIGDKSNNNETYMNMTDNKAKNNGTKKDDDKTKVEEDPGTYLIAFFVLFFFIGLYMICKMKEFKETKNRTDDVWKFLFFANNGALIGSTINIIFSNTAAIDYSLFVLCGIIFVIGTIYYIFQYIKKCNKEYATYYFSCEKAKEWFALPCFIMSLMELTDPCCRSSSYTVKEYSDGHKESTYCCNCTWNFIIYVVKRITLFMTIISYYIFLIFLLIFWFLVFLICNPFSTRKQNNDEKSNSNAQKSGSNDTQTNSTNNDGVNSTVKNHLENTASNSDFNLNLNNGEKKNQDSKSEGSIKRIKEYFNQPEENKNNKIGNMKSINAIQMNNNENFAQNKNNPGISSIPKSFAEFY